MQALCFTSLPRPVFASHHVNHREHDEYTHSRWVCISHIRVRKLGWSSVVPPPLTVDPLRWKLCEYGGESRERPVSVVTSAASDDVGAIDDEGSSGVDSFQNSSLKEEGGSSSSMDRRTAAAAGFWGALLEPICPRTPISPNLSLYNKDFAPTMEDGRILSVHDMASLWVGLVVGVPTYYMAGSLVEMGMSWWQGILVVLVANVLVLIPMVLSGHAGTKFGVPFPVLARASFGIRGANVPSLLRALVACGWFGIQTWIGGQAIFQLLNTLLNGLLEWPAISWLGISAAEFGSFMLFWLLQVGNDAEFIWSSVLQLIQYSFSNVWIWLLHAKLLKQAFSGDVWYSSSKW